MSDTLTTTVTWEDLIGSYDSELDEYTDAYRDLVTLLDEEYDADVDTPTDDDTVTAIQQQAKRYDEGVKEVQKRQHVLERLADTYGGGDFEIKMLSGSETMAVEREVRAALDDDTPQGVVQTQRNQLTVDTATVDAPSGVPTDDAGSPQPSEAPTALVLALWEHVERFNNAGATDFQAGGVSDEPTTPLSGSASAPSAAPSTSPTVSDGSAPSDDA